MYRDIDDVMAPEMAEFARGFGGQNLTAVETADFDKIAEELDPIKQFQQGGDPYDQSRYDTKVRYGRFNLDVDEEREKLEAALTLVVMGKGHHRREEWLTTDDGQVIVTLCWVEQTLKSEKKSEEKKKAS